MPVGNVLGEIDGGWTVAKALLGHERNMIADLFGSATGTRQKKPGSALANLARTLEKNDNLLVYYAGHGVLEEGEGYWLPVDASANRDKTWIGNAQISDFIANMEAKHVLVVAEGRTAYVSFEGLVGWLRDAVATKATHASRSSPGSAFPLVSAASSEY